MKLRNQLLIRCLTAAALLLGLFGALLISHSFDLQLTREREALEARSASLVQSAEAAAVNYALQSISLSDDLIEEIFTQLDASASLYAPNGMLMLGSAPPVMPHEGMHLIHRTLSALRPLSLGSQTYHLLVQTDLSALYQSRISLLTAYAVLYLAILTLFACLLLITASRVIRPIERLARISQALAENDMTIRSEISGSTETQALALSFNQMADHLTGQIERQQRFIADLTHEMKTPLTAMIGHADLIRTGRVTGEDAMLAAHRIAKEGQRLNTLNARLIDLILLGQDEITLTPLHPASLIEDTISALLPAAHAQEIVLSSHCDDALIMGDSALLRVLISNLADNALKSGASAVCLEGRLTSNHFTLSVRDNGRGMDNKTLSHLTEPFYRADKSRSRAQGGAGLGLSLCAQIAKLHGASLSFESALDRGTTASLTLFGKEASANEEP